MAGSPSPGIIAKGGLTVSRAVYYPFTIPQKLNDSATLTGAALNGMAKGINASIGTAYVALQPKGPAKWLIPLFQKVDAATTHSDEIAARNKKVFWDPFSQGTEQVGRALASPGAYYYLKSAGYKDPGNQDVIRGILGMGLFKYPTADQLPSPEQIEQMKAQAAGGGGGGGAPAQQAPPADQGQQQQQGPPPEASQQAAEGAGQAQPAA
jgi:hypothetical protein